MQCILFLCSRNQLRSPTAEAIFCALPRIKVDSAGLAKDAEVPVSTDEIEWADHIVVMEKIHRKRLNEQFSKSLKGKRITVLGIPDNYEFMEPELVDILKRKCAPFLS
ncbi:low molecular weight protein tyrosine phosphatase family protein [Akkermansiaceae bacterium]|nr:low molecular weight protein tyrosine phosphatase family protein [Akkermansiaceae bacterium]